MRTSAPDISRRTSARGSLTFFFGSWKTSALVGRGSARLPPYREHNFPYVSAKLFCNLPNCFQPHAT
jgi:hypothetical protein